MCGESRRAVLGRCDAPHRAASFPRELPAGVLMRLPIRLAAVLAAVLTCAGTAVAVVAVHPAASATVNLLANPGFESGLSGWSCGSGTATGGGAHSGAGALVGTPAGQDYA